MTNDIKHDIKSAMKNENTTAVYFLCIKTEILFIQMYLIWEYEKNDQGLHLKCLTKAYKHFTEDV